MPTFGRADVSIAAVVPSHATTVNAAGATTKEEGADVPARAGECAGRGGDPLDPRRLSLDLFEWYSQEMLEVDLADVGRREQLRRHLKVGFSRARIVPAPTGIHPRAMLDGAT